MKFKMDREVQASEKKRKREEKVGGGWGNFSEKIEKFRRLEQFSPAADDDTNCLGGTKQKQHTFIPKFSRRILKANKNVDETPWNLKVVEVKADLTSTLATPPIGPNKQQKKVL